MGVFRGNAPPAMPMYRPNQASSPEGATAYIDADLRDTGDPAASWPTTAG